MITTKLTTAEVAALSDAALNEYGAKLLGWHIDHYSWARGDGSLVPTWKRQLATSIDAQQAPGGPEEIGRSRGWWLIANIHSRLGVSIIASQALRTNEFRLNGDADKSEARLRMEAWCLALQEDTDDR